LPLWATRLIRIRGGWRRIAGSVSPERANPALEDGKASTRGK
jgi:hypothetical protein